jgi:hypothetical protein
MSVATPADTRFCLKREGIGGQYGNFLQRDGTVGILINLNGSLVKKSHYVDVSVLFF